VSLPLPETRLPGLAPLLNGGLWNEWVDRGHVFALERLLPAIRYVRLKPSSSCRLLVFESLDGTASEPPAGFLLHLYPDIERARMAFAKLSSRRLFIATAGHGPFLDETYAIVGTPFPNDPEVPGLRHVYRPHRLRLALTEALSEYSPGSWKLRREARGMNLLAYKPGRRAVYAVEVEAKNRKNGDRALVRLHVKLENPATCERSRSNLQRAHAALPHDADWRVPAPRGFVPRLAMVATEWIDGATLDALPCEGSTDAFAQAGRALAGFHRLDAALPALPTASDEEPILHGLARDLSLLLPEEESRIVELAGRIAARLRELPAAASTAVHGDFHPGQVVLDEGRPVIVDLDRAGRGRSSLDLGCFLAHLADRERGTEQAGAFVEGYVAASDGMLPDDLTVMTATALFRRAFFPFRGLLPDWPRQIRDRLDQAESLLSGCGWWRTTGRTV